MPASLAEEAISLLLELAEQGEINPWDVQVIDVVDRFLLRLAPQANTRDLSESGQAFLYAAMLVYLKAMALTDVPDAETEPLLEEDPEHSLTPWKPLRLEQVLKPRAVPRLNRTRPITLKDLIQHLQELESLLDQKTVVPKTRPQKVSRQQALATITQLAHPENLLETTTELEVLLVQFWQQGIPQIDFNDLVHHFNNQNIAPVNADHFVDPDAEESARRIQVFWALLLMASRSQVELSQETFYEDLSIAQCFVSYAHSA